jgi:uncharacterized repeat protein (TIGR01451 family)
MKTPRRAYRPEVVADLESRLALSHVAAAAAVQHVHQPAERAKSAGLMKPEFTVTWSESDSGTQVKTLKQTTSFGDGQFITNASTQLPDSETVAIGVPPNAALITISFQNTSKTNINSATISDKLNPGLTLEPGSVPSSTSGVVTTTTEADGVQTVQFNIDGGIAANEQGYVQFEVTRTR